MNSKPTAREREHMARIKEMDCIVCGVAGPVEAHHVRQSSAFYCLPVCKPCHTGRGGIHGEKHMWRLHKLDEVDALARLIRRLVEGAR